MQENIQDISVRAAKTFVQVFIAGVTAEAFTGFDIETIQSAGIAGLAAVISVVMNAALAWANKP